VKLVVERRARGLLLRGRARTLRASRGRGRREPRVFVTVALATTAVSKPLRPRPPHVVSQPRLRASPPPAECPRVNGVVCGGNGVCGYDDSAQTARCFCNDYSLVANCQSPTSSPPGGPIAGALIGGILLGVGVTLGIAFFVRSPAGAAKVGSGDGYYH